MFVFELFGIPLAIAYVERLIILINSKTSLFNNKSFSNALDKVWWMAKPTMLDSVLTLCIDQNYFESACKKQR
jgi:hypothetical protein